MYQKAKRLSQGDVNTEHVSGDVPPVLRFPVGWSSVSCHKILEEKGRKYASEIENINIILEFHYSKIFLQGPS